MMIDRAAHRLIGLAIGLLAVVASLWLLLASPKSALRSATIAHVPEPPIARESDAAVEADSRLNVQDESSAIDANPATSNASHTDSQFSAYGPKIERALKAFMEARTPHSAHMLASLSVALIIDATDPSSAVEMKLGESVAYVASSDTIQIFDGHKEYLCNTQRFPEYAELVAAMNYVDSLPARPVGPDAVPSKPPPGVIVSDSDPTHVRVDDELYELIMARAHEALGLIQ